jgi:hypothetical protein
MQLDPALVDVGRREREHEVGPGPHLRHILNDTPMPVRGATEPEVTQDGDREALRSERRAQLMREAEVMRAALRAKEREIDDLS